MVPGVPQFRRAVVDVEVAELAGFTLDNDCIQTGKLEKGAGVAVVPSVRAPLVTTLKLPEPITLVPPSGPVARIMRFSGSDHRTTGGTSS